VLDQAILRSFYTKLAGVTALTRLRSSIPTLAVWNDGEYGCVGCGSENHIKRNAQGRVLRVLRAAADVHARQDPGGVPVAPVRGAREAGPGRDAGHAVLPRSAPAVCGRARPGRGGRGTPRADRRLQRVAPRAAAVDVAGGRALARGGPPDHRLADPDPRRGPRRGVLGAVPPGAREAGGAAERCARGGRAGVGGAGLRRGVRRRARGRAGAGAPARRGDRGVVEPGRAVDQLAQPAPGGVGVLRGELRGDRDRVGRAGPDGHARRPRRGRGGP
jgi:hypothetical protein